MKERHDIDDIDIEFPNKKFFSNNLIVDIFIFTVAITSAVTTLIILYLLCKHNKLRAPVANLALQQVKEVSAMAMKQDTNNACTCVMLCWWYNSNSSYINNNNLYSVYTVTNSMARNGPVMNNYYLL